tara:strand:- start:3969 stop:8591 length:4623 start_codon:yes stop_codon:yes gene_type:complete
VGKLTVDSTAGLDTFINTIQRNTIILEDLSFYTATKQWDIKMPNVWVAAFNVKGIFSFNFRNTVNGTAANGYTLAFSGTTLTLKYNDATLATSTNIPNLDTTYGEVYVTFEKQYISVTIDGTIYLSYKDNVVRPALEGEFINFFNTSGLRLSNIKIVAGNWISDGTSNIFLMGGNLNVNEDALISSNLTVAGNALVSSNLFITGDINLTGNLKQNGSIFQAEGAWTKTGDNISYTTGNVSVGKDITVTGSVTSTTSLTSNVVTIGTTKTFVVTAAGGAFYIDGIIRKPIKLHQHQTYIFDLSSSTLLNNPFIFSESNNFDGTTSGTPYTTGITSTGTKRTFVVSASTPTTLYYYSTNTTLMGATVSISSTAELVVSGRVESTDLTLTGTGSLIVPSGTTAQRPVTAENGMIRYNSTTGSVEAYTTSSGWGAISAPPSITSVSPISVQGAHTGTQTFVVQGTGINTGSTVELEGVDGNRYSVFNTTTPAAAGYQISFQMGVFGAANGYDPLQAPYKIRIANSEGVAALGTATISLDAPTITGLSNNNLLTSATGSQVITLTGTGFTSSMTGTDKVLVLGVDGSALYTVDSVTIVSSTSLTFKLSATGVVLSSAQLANKPYKVRITGIFGNTVTGTDTINLLPPTITNISPLITLASGGQVGGYAGSTPTEMPQPPNAVDGDKLGWSVAVSGNGMYALAGSPYDDGGGSNSGALHIYVRNASTNAWTHQQELVIPSITGGDFWGYTQHAVSLSNDGTYAVAGAQYHNGNTGRARVWVRNGTSWSHQQELTISSMPTGAFFGSAVDISTDGNYIIIGAYSDDVLSSGAGAAHIFIRSGTTWSHQATLPRIFAGAAGTEFGVTVGISSDGTYAVVGSPIGPPNTGSAHIYIRSGTTWTHQKLMVDPNGQASDGFGRGVHISGDGNYAAIGAPGDASSTGAGHIFIRNGTSWTHQQQITITSAATGDYAFEQLKLTDDGTVLVVSVRGKSFSGTVYGSLVIFTRSGTNWTQTKEILSSDLPNPVSYDLLGYCSDISSDGTMIVAGAYGRDTGGTERGAMFSVLASEEIVDSSTQVFTVTGTGFTSSMTGADKAVVLGVDGSTEYPIDSVTIDSLTSLTFKLAASGVAIPSPQLANRPYKVKLTGNAGLTVTSTQTIGFSGISWTSPAAGATLATFSTTASANNTELDATDDIGGSGVTFSVPAANLPSGLTLNGSTGAITGIIGAVGTTSVTFRVTDNVTGATLDRTFSIVGINELYAFQTHTFTNLGASGRYGPTVNQNSYSGTGFYGNSSFFTQVSGKQGFQLWTVPRTATYTIKAYGSSGGRRTGATNPGYGAWTQGNFSLTEGEKLVIIVGQYYNFTGDVNNGGGGGGASWVLKEDYGGSGATPSSLYLVAGGGGGATSQNGGGSLQSYQHAGSSQAALVTPPGSAASSGDYSCGGGGSYGIDGAGGGTPGQTKGLRPYNGATGGNYGYNNTVYNNKGGFGGGGGSAAHAAGGGGGYVGGRGAPSYSGGGGYGGSSRNNGTSITFGQHTPFEHGKVIITQN